MDVLNRHGFGKMQERKNWGKICSFLKKKYHVEMIQELAISGPFHEISGPSPVRLFSPCLASRIGKPGFLVPETRIYVSSSCFSITGLVRLGGAGGWRVKSKALVSPFFHSFTLVGGLGCSPQTAPTFFFLIGHQLEMADQQDTKHWCPLSAWKKTLDRRPIDAAKLTLTSSLVQGLSTAKRARTLVCFQRCCGQTSSRSDAWEWVCCHLLQVSKRGLWLLRGFGCYRPSQGCPVEPGPQSERNCSLKTQSR